MRKESARERLRKSSLLEFSQTFEGREYMSKKATRANASGAFCECIPEDRESASRGAIRNFPNYTSEMMIDINYS